MENPPNTAQNKSVQHILVVAPLGVHGFSDGYAVLFFAACCRCFSIVGYGIHSNSQATLLQESQYPSGFAGPENIWHCPQPPPADSLKNAQLPQWVSLSGDSSTYLSDFLKAASPPRNPLSHSSAVTFLPQLANRGAIAASNNTLLALERKIRLLQSCELITLISCFFTFINTDFQRGHLYQPVENQSHTHLKPGVCACKQRLIAHCPKLYRTSIP